MPDELQEFNKRWETCVACPLKQRITDFEFHQVFGVGYVGGIMFISDYPREEAELTGNPLSGDSMLLLKAATEKYGIDQYSYYTHVSICRSAQPATTKSGGIKTYRNKKGKPMIIWQDMAMTSDTMNTCRVRIFQEIYLVDPLLIVTLGPYAKAAILKDRSALSSDRGNFRILTVEGRSRVPVLTEKRKKWVRSYKNGNWKVLTKPRSVQYLCMSTYHPDFVTSTINSKDTGSDEFMQFMQDIELVAKTFHKYKEVIYGE